MSYRKVLFIEDQPESIEPIKEVMEEAENGFECKVCDFEQADKNIDGFMPDLIILDIRKGDASPDPEIPGKELFDNIWKSKFCPIIVYSALPDYIPAEYYKHPFVKRVEKGRNGTRNVLTQVKILTPHISALNDAEAYIKRQFSLALRIVAPYAFQIYHDSSHEAVRNDLILRSGRRRLAAMLDNFGDNEEKILSWEQYIIPPLPGSPMLGDLLIRKDCDANEPSSYRLVLSPSCDLASSEKRSAKVKLALVATCYDMGEGIEKIGKTIKNNAEFKKYLKDILSQGFIQNLLFLPKYADKIPYMVADLRDLQLIPLKKMSAKSPKYLRIASVDSPFRELIAWAYMQTACRPGLPDRDQDEWSRGIIEAHKRESNPGAK